MKQKQLLILLVLLLCAVSGAWAAGTYTYTFSKSGGYTESLITANGASSITQSNKTTNVNVASNTSVEAYVKTIDNVRFTYTCGSTDKSSMIQFREEGVYTNGGAVSINIQNVTVGSEITLSIKSKNSTASTLDVISGATADVDNAENFTESFVNMKYTATAGTVVLKNPSNGFILESITVSDPSFTVTYKANGGTGEDVVENATSVADNPFTYGSNIFKGWNTSANGSGTDYAVGDAVTSELTLYAQWIYVPEMTTKWDIDFTSLYSTEYSENTFGSTYYNLTAKETENGESVALNENFGVAAKENENKNSFYIHNGGLYAFYGGGRDIAFNNLEKGEFVRVTTSEAPNSASAGLTLLSDYSGGNKYVYQVTVSGVQTIKLNRYTVIYKVEVLRSVNEIVGLLDCSTGWTGAKNTIPICINAGETVKYSFVNYNTGTGNVWNNWYLLAKATADADANVCDVRADQYTDEGVTQENTLGDFNYVTDYNGAKVDVVISLARAGDEIYTLTATTTITKADGTAVSGSKVDTATGLTQSTLYLYMSVFNSWLKLLEQAVKKDISSYGYATFSSTNAVNVDVDGLEAYVVTGNNGRSITTEKITGDVAANTGLILKGNAGTYSLPVVASGTIYNTESNPVNYMFALDGSYKTLGAANAGGTNYVLTVQNDKVVFAPIKNTPAPVKAGQAALWLQGESGPAKALALSFGDDVTGIEAVSTVEPQGAKTYYNLQGQRVSEPKQGIYVVDGKKVLVK